MAFSKKEFKDMEAGKIVTKLLDTDVKQEIVLTSTAWVNVSKEFYVKNYIKVGKNISTAAANVWGEFSSPPAMEDVWSFTLPLSDLKELAKYKPGKCKVKAPAIVMKTLSQLDKSAPYFENRANILVQRGIMEYIKGYLKNGNSALVEYQDKEYPIKLAEELQGLLENSPNLKKYVPALYSYLMKFPEIELPNAQNSIYWMRDHFEGKVKHPITSINHMVFYQPPESKFAIVASKQLYATHYFEGSLRVTAMLNDPESKRAGFYLLHLNRSRIDILRETSGFLAKILFKSTRNLLHKRMKNLKKNLETGYQAKF